MSGALLSLGPVSSAMEMLIFAIAILRQGKILVGMTINPNNVDFDTGDLSVNKALFREGMSDVPAMEGTVKKGR